MATKDVMIDRLDRPPTTARWHLRSLVMPFLFLLPATVFLLIFMAVPVVDAILLSFQKWDGLNPATWVGLRNYRLLLEDDVFVQALKNTVYFTLATVVLQTTIPLLVANLINSGIKGGAIFRLIYFLPVIISLTITGMLWRMILEPNFGMLNELLRNIGLKEWTQLWLADKQLVIPSIIFVSIWQSLGFYLVIFFAALQNIPEDLYEAASIDGANAWHRFRHVTVPMLRGTLIVVVVLNTINGFKVFDQVWVMTTGGPNHASETLGTYLYRTAFGAQGSSNPQLGYATAIAMLILLVSFVFSVIQIRVGQIREVEL
ncbi:carbohydrate ABC transporter permease [Aggregatilinea lenta]|uniref:carbohydrate ABC transporter permease n=1 Tax=Aggregatilinea lenta TaxID=913108 RepID=UPI000E5BDB6A|nr:sugar ABC transporter permease [Aggregatilinea lenta]